MKANKRPRRKPKREKNTASAERRESVAWSKRLDKVTQESRERFLSLAEETGVPIVAIDPKGRFIHANEATSDLLGYSQEELLRYSFGQLLHHDDKARILRLFAKIILLRRPLRKLEFRVIRKDGSIRYVWSKPTRLVVGGATVGFQAIMVDVTDRVLAQRLLEESEKKHRTLFETMVQGVVYQDASGKIISANPAAEKILGLTLSQMQGRTSTDSRWKALHEDGSDFPGETHPAMVALRTGNEVRNVVMGVFNPKKEAYHWISINAVPQFKPGERKPFQIHTTFDDITERRRTEEEIRDLARFPSENPNPILRLDGHGTILSANKASKTLIQEWGSGIGQVAPKFWRELVTSVLSTGESKDIDIESGGKSYTFFVRPVAEDRYVNLYGRDITERKRMEEALRRSEERFRQVFQSSPIPYLITLPEGPIVDVNDAWMRMSGYNREEAIGRSTIELGMVLDPEQRNQLVRDLLQKRRLSDVEITRRTKSGELRDLLNSPELVELGGQTCILNMQVDITERKRMEKELERHAKRLEELVEDRTKELKESEEKFRRISEASLDAIYTTSLDGEILDMNPAGVSMFGFESLDELKKVSIRSLYVNPNDHMRLIELADKGPVKGFEAQFRRKDGKIVDVITNHYALRDGDGGVVGFQGALTNVTEHKELERIKDEITSAALVEITRSRELEKMKEQLISAVTHELRTPLVSVKGYVDLALSAGPEQISKEVESQLQVVKRNTDRLLSLVNDLLDVQRMTAGRLQLELHPIDFKTVIDSCMEEIAPLVADRKLSLRVEVPEGKLPIRGDQVRLCQVLMNLLGNAVKFSPEGSQVTVHVEEDYESIKVRVSDRGIGIRKEDLQRIFEPFATIEKPSYIKGTGLGLSITKGLVEAHGGKIWAESPGEGKGAAFTFTLPKE